jgi:glutathione S-transferase
MILPKVGWPVIPVLVLVKSDGTESYIQDSADIVAAVEQLHPALPAFPDDPAQRAVCHLVELLADQWLVLPAMHFRWNFPEQRNFLEHEWGLATNPQLGVGQRTELARASMKMFENAAVLVGASQDMAAPIEHSFARLLELLEAHLCHHTFLLAGDRPTMSDFAMMGPFYAHLYRDPVPGHLLRTRAPLVASWVERCMRMPSAVESPERRSVQAISSQREISPTLIAIVAHMLNEYSPVLCRTAGLFREACFTEDVKVPRLLGMVEYSLAGRVGRRGAFSFDLWRAQGFFDWLHGCGLESWMITRFGRAADEMLALARHFRPDGELRVKRVENVLRRGYRDPKAPYSEYKGAAQRPAPSRL